MSELAEGMDDLDRGGEDRRLVLAARRGRQDAFEALVERYQRQATSVAYRLLNNMDDAQEVVQDAFLRAYNKLTTLDDPARFGAWLLRIVSNVALNKRRSRALRRTAPLETGEGDEAGEMLHRDPKSLTGEAVASAQDLRDLLERAIADLPELQQRAIVMFCLEQMPQKEIADIMKCSLQTVKWNVFEARKRLRVRLKNML